jgi:hypothetical protein
MSYVHFDLKQVETTMREMREASLADLLAATTCAETKVGYLAQDRFFEAHVAAQVQMMGLLNDNRSPVFVGNTIGSFVGNVIVNTIAASAEPEACWDAIMRTMQQSVGALNEDGPQGLSCVSAEIYGTSGGRA